MELIEEENEVQKWMRGQKLDSAIECGCERCKEIVNETDIEILISNFKNKYPDVDFDNIDSKNWSDEKKKDAIDMTYEILEILNK